MSIHVCKCDHNGRTEYHLRYPGMTQEEAQRLADKINGGALEARAALSAGDAVDAQRYRWLMENVVGFECCPPTLLIRLPEDVVFDFSNPSAAIDAAMRKGQL